MRTTVAIDDDVLAAARALAESERIGLGAALSTLARRGLQASAPTRGATDFPTFAVRPGSPPITSEDVRRALDEP